MSFIYSVAVWGLKTWFPQYESPVEKAIRIEQKIVPALISIFKTEGIDLSTIFSTGLDLRHIEDIQTALNKLVLEPAGQRPLSCDGIFDFSEAGPMRQAIMTFQRKTGLTVDGWPGAGTSASLRKALVKADIAVRGGA